MGKKIIHLTTLCVGLWSSVLLAQQKDAESVLMEVAIHGQSMRDFYADFRYETQTVNHRDQKRKGKIYYMDHRYVILLNEVEIYIDGIHQWVYFPSKNEVVLSPYEVGGTNVMELLFQIFAHKTYSEYLGEEPVDGEICDKLRIIVEDLPSLTFKEVYVWVGRTPRMFRKATFLDNRHNSTIFEFIDIQTNNGMQVSDFSFETSAYPNVIIIDRQD